MNVTNSTTNILVKYGHATRKLLLMSVKNALNPVFFNIVGGSVTAKSSSISYADDLLSLFFLVCSSF